MEAFGTGDVEGCSVSQEEAKTDAAGAFRIRGLTPGCNYKVFNMPYAFLISVKPTDKPMDLLSEGCQN